MTDLLKDDKLTRAVSSIVQRSERQPDLDVLERTYVDTGVLPQLDNRNSQILYGRRGTGKSHVFRVLGAQAERQPNVIHAYVDVRLLGSSQSVLDPSLSVGQRSITLFRDLIAHVHDSLLAHATDPDTVAPNSALENVAELGKSINRVIVSVTNLQRREKRDMTSSRHTQTSGDLTPSNPGLGFQADTDNTVAESSEQEFMENLRETVVFADVARALDDSLAALDLRILVLVDEWSAIPAEVQPFVAEIIKRTILPTNRVTLKIASLEYRSNFSVPLANNNLIGFEVGGDIFANLDLDDYYVYERAPDQVVSSFQELLFRHVQAELPNRYLEDVHDVLTAAAFRSRLFTERATFIEAVRAGEGVVRDFLGIVSSAYFRATRRGRLKIDMNSVEEAARDWYETDKSANLSDEQQRVLHKIIEEVIGARRARSFLIDRSAALHPMIQSLFDLRLLHLMRRGYSDKQNPGLRYNIYTLDYGTYVDLKRTKSQPELGLLEGVDDAEDRLVPFDDQRSIRRIILDPAILEPPVD
jgi:hypothetical protein